MMDIDPFVLNIVIFVLIFLGVLLAYEGLQQLVFRQETRSETRNRRMKMIQSGASSDEVLELLRDPVMMDGQVRRSPIARLHRLMVQAGLAFKPIWFFLIMIVLGAGIFYGATLVIPPEPALALSVIMGFVLPLMVLLIMKESRLQQLTKQLPDALDLMARGLKVGHPVAVTVGNVANDMPDPIGTEFGLIQDQINYGDDVATAFHDFAGRVGTEDAHYLAVSVGIQHGTGGNLARILNVLSQVVRDRHTMRKKIKAISAEGRLSAMILTILPMIIYGSIELSTPTFYGDVRSDPLFPFFAYTIVGLIVMQGFLLYRLVKFKF